MPLVTKYNLRDAGTFFETPAEKPAETPATETVEDEFDKERAMATIKNLRAFEKQAKELQKQLDALKVADDERKTKELSDVQKAEKKAQEAQAAKDALEQRYRTTAIKSAIRLAAATAGFVDPEDAVLNLADSPTIELGDDDKVTGAAEAVKELAKAKPHLLAATRPQAPNINAQGGGNPRPLTLEELKQQRRDTDSIYTPF